MRVQDEKKKWRREEEKKYIEKWLVRSAMALVAVLDWCIERWKQQSYSLACHLQLLIPYRPHPLSDCPLPAHYRDGCRRKLREHLRQECSWRQKAAAQAAGNVEQEPERERLIRRCSQPAFPLVVRKGFSWLSSRSRLLLRTQFPSPFCKEHCHDVTNRHEAASRQCVLSRSRIPLPPSCCCGNLHPLNLGKRRGMGRIEDHSTLHYMKACSGCGGLNLGVKCLFGR
jgi:hypothetical protein